MNTTTTTTTTTAPILEAGCCCHGCKIDGTPIHDIGGGGNKFFLTEEDIDGFDAPADDVDARRTQCQEECSEFDIVGPLTATVECNPARSAYSPTGVCPPIPGRFPQDVRD
jgi:hypothetical protein